MEKIQKLHKKIQTPYLNHKPILKKQQTPQKQPTDSRNKQHRFSYNKLLD